MNDVVNVSRLKVDRTETQRIYVTPSPPVRTSRTGTLYVIEAIVGHRKDEKGAWEYFVKWEEWEAKDNTWEKEWALARAKQMLREYWATQGGVVIFAYALPRGLLCLQLPVEYCDRPSKRMSDLRKHEKGCRVARGDDGT
jgi:hypothetical protein